MNELQVLFKSNALVKAKHELNVVDNRIMQLVFLNIQKNNIHKEYNNVAIITKNDLKNVITNKTDRTKGDINKLLNDLEKEDSKKIQCDDSYIDQALERLRKNNINVQVGKMRGGFSLISAWRYVEDTDKIQVEVPNLLLGFLRDYKETGYTPINVTKYISINSSNSQRIYELIRAWSGTNTSVEYTVDELKEYLMLTNKYKVFADFKKRVIEPSRCELREKELLDIYKVEYIKKGNKIHSIRFYVRDLEPRTYNFTSKKIIDSNFTTVCKVALTNSKKKPLLADKTLKELAKKYGEEEVNISYEILKTNNSIEKVKAPKKYIIGILDNRKKDFRQSLNRINNKPSNFNNFTQREYDYEKLERQLLGWASDEEYDDD